MRFRPSPAMSKYDFCTPKKAPRWPQEGPTPQDGPKMTQDGPKMAQDRGRWVKIADEELKFVLRSSKTRKC